MIKKSYGVALTGTIATIYTVPSSKKAEWVLMYLTNTSGSNGTVTVQYYNAAADSTLNIFDGYTISSKEFFQIGGNVNEFILMRAGDQIKASATQTMTILVSVIESNDVITGG
jgi:hypothetical protein